MSLRILFAEDDRVNRLMVKSLLTKMGCEVCLVTTGEEAVQHQREEGFDLVLMDQQMPGMGGFEAARKIRELPSPQAGVPIIGMSITPPKMDELSPDGDKLLDDFLKKPVSKKQINELVEYWSQHKRSEAAKTPDTNETTGYKILAADDDIRNEFVLKSVFKRSVHSLDVVPDGEKAVQACMEKKYDLVLMDVMMPIMDGRKATEEILKIDGYQNTPIIGVTALTDEKNKKQCFDAGMCQVIPKPFTKEVLLGAVDYQLGISEKEEVQNSPTNFSNKTTKPILFNYEQLVNEFGGEKDLAVMALDILVKDIPIVAASMAAAIEDRDCNTLRKHAHKIRGAAANLTCIDLSQTADKIEKNAEADDLEQAEQELSRFRAKGDKLLDYLKENNIVL